MELNKKIEEELNKQFPKGDKARGRALVLHTIAQLEYDDLKKSFELVLKEITRLREELK